MNKKRVFKILGIIFIIIMVLFIIYFCVIHFDGFLNKDNKMTREEIIALLEKGKEYPNYYYSSEEKGIMGWIERKYFSDVRTEVYVKDNIVKNKTNNKVETITWTNYDTEEYIDLMGEYKGKKVAFVKNFDEIDMSAIEENQAGFDYSLISQEEIFNTEFKYLGEKKVDGRTIIMVKLWDKDDFSINSTKFYIDKESGLITRRVDYAFLGLVRFDCDRNVKLDVVTDKDVERPNLEEYEIH